MVSGRREAGGSWEERKRERSGVEPEATAERALMGG
jgi:hypothetical protein